MYFHTDNLMYIWSIAEAASRAESEGRRFRVNVDADGNLTYKVGEGMWSPPFESTPDPYRDGA